MFHLPESTVYNRLIPRDTLFTRAITAPSLRDVYEEQVARVVWANKLARETYTPYAGVPTGVELEIFNIETKTHTLDKRLLRQIDKSIPYYIFHLVKNEQQYQAWIADKAPSKRSIQVQNYYRTGWLNESDLTFDFAGNTPKATVKALIEQVEAIRRPIVQEQAEVSSAFMAYFRDMKMTRSYKPVLIMATIQSGGSITLEKAASQFMRFYQGRAKRGLTIEKSYCVYGDPNAPVTKVYANLIKMPIQALCNSGYFVYDKEARIFSFKDGLYDGLTLQEIDEITSICNMRLHQYFEKLR